MELHFHYYDDSVDSQNFLNGSDDLFVRWFAMLLDAYTFVIEKWISFKCIYSSRTPAEGVFNTLN